MAPHSANHLQRETVHERYDSSSKRAEVSWLSLMLEMTSAASFNTLVNLAHDRDVSPHKRCSFDLACAKLIFFLRVSSLEATSIRGIVVSRRSAHRAFPRSIYKSAICNCVWTLNSGNHGDESSTESERDFDKRREASSKEVDWGAFQPVHSSMEAWRRITEEAALALGAFNWFCRRVLIRLQACKMFISDVNDWRAVGFSVNDRIDDDLKGIMWRNWRVRCTMSVQVRPRP